MILCDKDILQEIENGNLRFDPMIETDQVSTSSIDLRLANVFTVPNEPKPGISVAIDPGAISAEDVFDDYAEKVAVPSGDTFELNPGGLCLRIHAGTYRVAKRPRSPNRRAEFNGAFWSLSSPKRPDGPSVFRGPTQARNIQRRTLYRPTRTWDAVLSTDC